jgi:glycerate-2-kinase
VRRIIVCGVGKCAGRAAAELERALGDRITDGLVITVGDTPALRRIRAIKGTHPFPSETNMRASQALLELVSGLTADDLVICLVTGGGSTLLCLPEDGNVERESLIFGAFMNAGARIEEINTVRKHMSRVRGGFLAQAMYPAHVVSLIMNDVPGSDDIGFIASGPTVKDTTTIEDAQAVLEKYGILQACNLSGCGLMETPKDQKYFERVRNVVVVSNQTALEAMKREAERRGYRAEIRDKRFSGEARDVGKRIARELRAAPPKTALLYGGETTVTVRHGGRGGRNQEFILGALQDVPDGGIVISSTSDGRDNTEFGGALCDRMTKERAAQQHLDAQAYLAENRSYDFFASAGDALIMGDTGSNVSDLVVAMKE